MTSAAFQNETLQCCSCFQPFTFSAEQQEEYQRRGHKNKPKRCPGCRSKKRNADKNGKMSVEETVGELCKAVTELRIYNEQQFKKLHHRLDEIEDSLFEDD
jgi:primosomal protein N'